MNGMNRILAATDLSAPARHAAERAALVAGQTGAALDLIHVASVGPLEKLRQLVGELPAELEQSVLDAARDELRELAAMLVERHGVAAGVSVVAGPLLAEMAGRADAIAADLVVLGARGASFMRHLLLGSTAERMLNQIVRPMLVVKQAAHERYRNVLVAIDFSPASVSALRQASAVAPGGELILLHVFDVPFEGKLRLAGIDEATINHYRVVARQDALQKLNVLCTEAGLPPSRTRLLVLHGDPSQRIVEQEQENDCDLIVVGKQGESMIDALLGSVSRHVLSESQCDVLVAV